MTKLGKVIVVPVKDLDVVCEHILTRPHRLLDLDAMEHKAVTVDDICDDFERGYNACLRDIAGGE